MFVWYTSTFVHAELGMYKAPDYRCWDPTRDTHDNANLNKRMFCLSTVIYILSSFFGTLIGLGNFAVITGPFIFAGIPKPSL